MLRFSPSAPVFEQLQTMEAEERLIFKTGSKSTLKGAWDAVYSLAADDRSGAVYAGGPGGRVELAGVVVIGQSDSAVTTKIVAHDGMILEQ